MKQLLAFAILLLPSIALAQMSGNQVYDNGNRYNSEQSSYRRLNPTSTLSDSTFVVDGTVLMNVKADEFLAVFGIVEVQSDLATCEKKIDERIDGFRKELRGLGIPAADIYVDLITQNPVNDYRLEGDVATQYRAGFEVERNIVIHYKEHGMVEQLLMSAAQFGIYDLVKVEYIVKDPAAIFDQMVDKADAIIAKKRDRYVKLTGCTIKGSGQIYADNRQRIAPKDNYRAYTASESSTVSRSGFERNVLTRKDLKPTSTFYFNGIEPGSFDLVINPIILEPVVQFTLDLAVRYERARP